MNKDRVGAFIGCLVFWTILAWIVVKMDRSDDAARSETVETISANESKEREAN